MTNMIKEIESAVIAHLKKHWSGGVAEFNIGKGFADLTKWPAIAVTTEKIEFDTVGGALDGRCSLCPIVSVYAVFKAVQPDTRRGGVYPMVTAIPALLIGKDLGLDIAPFEPNAPIVEVFHAALVSGGMAAFRIDLKTEFELELLDDGGAMQELLVTANDYIYREWASDTQVIDHVS